MTGQPPDVQAWKDGARGKSTSALIAYKLQRQSADERALGLSGIIEQFPQMARTDLEDQIKAMVLVAHTAVPWKMDCAEFYEWIEKVTRGNLAKRGVLSDDDTLFDAFEAVCLALTRAVETNPNVRRASGISEGFPWLSTAALAIPVAAMFHLARTTPASTGEILGYGITNLAYVLFVAGILVGAFRIFGLKGRWRVLGAAIVCWVVGVVLVNMR